MWGTAILGLVKGVPMIIELVEAIRGRGNGSEKSKDAQAALIYRENEAGIPVAAIAGGRLAEARKKMIDANVAYANELRAALEGLTK